MKSTIESIIRIIKIKDKGLKMGFLKFSIISTALASLLIAGDDVVLSPGDVVVRGGDETIVVSDAADEDSLVINDNSIVVSNRKRDKSYYPPQHQPRRAAPAQASWNGVVEDISCDSVEVKHSNQGVGTAEVPVIYRLHPHTVHQYK